MNKLPDVKNAVKLGRMACNRYRRILDHLVTIGAEDEQIDIARARLKAAEEIHAEDMAELRRLTTH